MTQTRTLRPLRVSDFAELKPYFEGQRLAYSTYSLPSLIVWNNHIYQPHWFLEEDSLVFAWEFTERKSRRHLSLPVCPGREWTPEELKDLCGRTGFRIVAPVPNEYLERHGRERVESVFKVEELFGQADYVYRTADLANLEGRKYAKKRNLVRQFEREYLSPGRVAVEPMTFASISECLEFLDAWCAERDCDGDPTEEMACEKEACRNAVRNIESLPFQGVLLRVDGIVRAFAVSSRLRPDMSVLHFEKACATRKGLYQYFDKICAQRLFPRCEYVNKEFDMNVPGLAKAKRSYHPAAVFPAYKLTLPYG